VSLHGLLDVKDFVVVAVVDRLISGICPARNRFQKKLNCGNVICVYDPTHKATNLINRKYGLSTENAQYVNRWASIRRKLA
jgi:hypothetical protein